MANSKATNCDTDVISQVDFTKGFTNWHVKWKINNVLEDQYSTEFQTGPSCRWRLWLKKNGETFRFAIQPLNLAGILVVYCRFAIQLSDQQQLHNQSGVSVFILKPYHNFGINIPIDTARSFEGADLVLHCWIDVPNCLDGNPGSNISATKSSAIAPGLLACVLSDHPGPTTYSDIGLVLIDEDKKAFRRFHCHRCVLAPQSDVFARMFADDAWKEAAKGEVEINDIDEKTMEIVLTYIYSGRLPDNKCTINASILYAAAKYNLPGLIRWCEIDLITYHNGDAKRIDHLKLADMYGLHQLKAVCVATLATNVSLIKEPGNPSAIDGDLLDEVITEAGRRQLVTKHMTVSNE